MIEQKVNTNRYTFPAILFVAMAASVLVIGIGTISSADAERKNQECQGESGFDRGDCNVHENTPGGFGGDQDVRFHEGTCQGEAGSDHPACDFDIITEPGESDENRQDN